MGFIPGAHRHEASRCPERRDDDMAAETPVRFLEACVEPLNLPLLGFPRAPPAVTSRPASAPAELWQLSMDGALYHLRSRRRLAQETHQQVGWLGV